MRGSFAWLLSALVGCGPGVVEWPLDPPALKVSRNHVRFGSALAEEQISEWITVRNVGEVPTGIVPSLVSQDRPWLGDVGAFTLVDGCDDVLHTGEFGCLLEPGEDHRLEVTYTPTADGVQGDAILLRTAGDQHVPEIEDLPDLQRHFIDPERPRSLVFLTAEGMLGDASLHLRTRRVHLGWPGPEQRVQSSVALSNTGRTELVVHRVRRGVDCDPLFELPQIEDEVVPVGGSLWLDFAYPAMSAVPEPARCRVEVVASSEQHAPQHHRMVIEVATGERPLNLPPRLLLLEPRSPQVVYPGGEVVFWINVKDVDDHFSDLSCGVSTSSPDARFTLARCKPSSSNADIRLVVPIPGVFEGDVLRAFVRDGHGALAEATIPVMVPSSRPIGDRDRDMFSVADGDCDDDDATVYPMAVELLDGKDNDCDNRVDEDTAAGDDDGDGVSEQGGDCDDADVDVYPGAPEVLNHVDDDCDGLVDEGTAIWDDDHDGWSELDGDCDDADPNVHPGAVEWCGDQVDDDCDGSWDQYDLDGCREAQHDPRFFGGIDLSRSAAEVGESVRACVVAHDADGDEVQIQWSASRGGTMAMPAGTCADWLMPDEMQGRYERIWLYATALDGRGGSSQARAELWLLPDGGLDVVLVREEEPVSTCESAPGAVSSVWLTFPLLFCARRRRRCGSAWLRPRGSPRSVC